MENFKVFHTIDLIIQSYVQLIVNQLESDWASGILQLATVSVSLYVLVYGYMVLAGKIATPMQDFVWNIVRLALILAVISNQGSLLNAINDGVDDLKQFLVGDEDIYVQIDQMLAIIATDCLKLWSKFNDKSVGNSMQSVLQLLCYLPIILAFCALGAMVALADISLKVLLATAPIFLFCLMWGFLRNSFNRWASAIVGSLFVLLFSVVLVRFSKIIVRQVHMLSDNTMVSMLMILVFGVVFLAIIKWSRDVAMSLASFTVSATRSGVSTQLQQHNTHSGKRGK